MLCQMMLPTDVDEEPSAAPRQVFIVNSDRTQIFISYSHKDKKWIKLLKVHLRPLQQNGIVDLWDDTKIVPGVSWRDEIERALAGANAAIILVSADFLASEFITTQELPVLLERARTNGTRIVPLLVSPCRYAESALGHLQALNSVHRTLSEMTVPERNRTFLALIEQLESGAT